MFSFSILKKNEDICSKESSKGVDEQHTIRRLVWVWTVTLISHLRRTQGQRWGYTSRNCQLVLNGTENMDRNSRRLSELDPTGIENRAIPWRTFVIFQGKTRMTLKMIQKSRELPFPLGGQASSSSVPKRRIFSFSESRMLLPSASGVGPHSLSLGGEAATPVSLEDRAANQRGLFLSCKI